MIKSVTIKNYLGESFKLDLFRPEESGIRITSIDGLGPVKANINTMANATDDGDIFNSARLNGRNVIFDLEFMFKPTIEAVRHKTYEMFPIKKKVEMTFETDIRTSYTTGYVESNEPNIFSKDEGTSISIICPDPYLYSKDMNQTYFSGVESEFEFPFSNESLTENLLVFSSLWFLKEQTVLYEGDLNMGVVIHIHALGPVSGLVIHSISTGGTISIDDAKLKSISGGGIQYGDSITISTVKGDKFINLLRDGVYYNLLNTLSKTSEWFILDSGDNLFVYSAKTGESNLQFMIENRIAYEGV